MRHHAEHVAPGVDDASDVVPRPVWVGARHDTAIRIAKTKHDLPCLPEPRQRGGIGEVAALAVRDGDAQDPSLLALRREWEIGPLDDEVGPLAAKLERGVSDESAWEQARLAQDLKPIADAPHQTAPVGELADLLHHRSEPGDRPGAQVVAVCKAARQDHAVAAFEVGVLVPQVGEVRAQYLVDHPAAVAVRPRAREYDHSKLHRRPSLTMSKRKSSLTGVASGRRHMASTRSRASCSLDPSRLSSMYLPTRTSETSLKPSAARPCLTVTPCGSLTTGLGVTTTMALMSRSSACAGTAPCRPPAGTQSDTEGESAPRHPRAGAADPTPCPHPSGRARPARTACRINRAAARPCTCRPPTSATRRAREPR